MRLFSNVREVAQRGRPVVRPGSLYGHSLPMLDGSELDLAARRGRPTLVVNVASRCGFAGQYRGLEQLSSRYAEDGLVVIGTPSSDFGDLEFGNAGQIQRFAEEQFLAYFPLTERMSVRFQPHPFWRDIASQPASGPPVWNFTKYLIDGDGRVRGWWSTNVNPESARIHGAIEHLLAA